MTITVRLPADIEQALRKKLEKKGITVSEFVRDLIARDLAEPTFAPGYAYDAGADLFERSAGERDDLSERDEDILKKKLRAKHHS